MNSCVDFLWLSYYLCFYFWIDIMIIEYVCIINIVVILNEMVEMFIVIFNFFRVWNCLVEIDGFIDDKKEWYFYNINIFYVLYKLKF